MAEKKIYLVPTDESVNDPLVAERAKRLGIPLPKFLEQSASSRQRLRDRLHRAVELGVPIAAGSDNYLSRSGMNRGQGSMFTLDALREEGLTPWQVLSAATCNAADLLGWGDRTGSLQAGYLADIIAVRGDPLADRKALRSVLFVMKAGKIVRGS